MTLQEAAALATERSLNELLYTLKRTPDERLTWKPGEVARTALNVAAECVVATENWTKIFSALEFPTMEEFGASFGHLDDYTSREQVVEALKRATAEFAATVRALPDDKLSVELTACWGESAPVGAWLFHVAGHDQYHLGQIAYIQTLYGDTSED